MLQELVPTGLHNTSFCAIPHIFLYYTIFQPFSQIYSVNVLITHVICTSFLHSVSFSHANVNNHHHHLLESEKPEAADLCVFCFKTPREGQTLQKCSNQRLQFIALPPSYLEMSLQPASSSSSCPALSSRMMMIICCCGQIYWGSANSDMKLHRYQLVLDTQLLLCLHAVWTRLKLRGLDLQQDGSLNLK